MDIINIATIAFLGIILSIIIKQNRPDIAFMISIVCCIMILLSGISKLTSIMEVFENMQEIILIDEKYMKYLIKIIGISYISGFASDVCKDSGHTAMAGQIDIFAKVSILTISLPVVLALVELISEVVG
ncbi:MAG: stage III sporulation protein AD [Lachnospiraceae bacterium]|nr:stage III sporulation protein AD [Lachnospiraceae bacterium]